MLLTHETRLLQLPLFQDEPKEGRQAEADIARLAIADRQYQRAINWRH